MIRFAAPFLLCLCLPGAPAAAQTMTGPRIEATIGYDRLSSDEDFEDLPDTLQGIRIGGALGYDAPLGRRLTIGVEGSAAWTIDARKTTALAADRLHQDLGRDLDLSVRAGLRLSPKSLAFAKAGYANSRFDITYDARIIGGTERIRSHSNRGGLRLGAGVEHNLGGRLYAKAEYRWTRYDHEIPYMEKASRNQFLLGFGTRF